MRHNYKGRKLGTDFAHTKAMKRSLVQALFLNDRIKTIESRAKEIRPDVDKIITWAKKGDLHSRRLAIAALGNDKELVREIFEKVAQGMFADRQGGYTRIMKLGNRKGDNAPWSSWSSSPSRWLRRLRSRLPRRLLRRRSRLSRNPRPRKLLRLSRLLRRRLNKLFVPCYFERTLRGPFFWGRFACGHAFGFIFDMLCNLSILECCAILHACNYELTRISTAIPLFTPAMLSRKGAVAVRIYCNRFLG